MKNFCTKSEFRLTNEASQNRIFLKKPDKAANEIGKHSPHGWFSIYFNLSGFDICNKLK